MEIRNTLANTYQPMNKGAAATTTPAPVVYLSEVNQETSA